MTGQPIPITIITGFLGSGKTTLILNLIPQLPPTYKLALLKNEFGDLAVDSQLASSASISGVQELLNGCICCNLVGQLGDALDTLRNDVVPDRIVIETSGSAFPATLAMEVNRLGRETGNYVLDGVVVVIDVENWKGYEDTSYTAKLQAKYTDLIVFNKWEQVDERRYDDCLDRMGDMDVETAYVKSDKGFVRKDVILGIDGGLARELMDSNGSATTNGHSHEHAKDHQKEVEVLSVTLSGSNREASVDLENMERFLRTAPKDQIYRIKAVLVASSTPSSSDDNTPTLNSDGHHDRPATRYILNWAFGRWTFTPLAGNVSQVNEQETQPSALQPGENTTASTDEDVVLRMTIILARDEANKWKRNLEKGKYLGLQHGQPDTNLVVTRLL
ncbi:MAG: hypothetical protein M1812_000597 [Candelaria pacifica]|nr:MAG: hypothetical protein M1812_000597 [Candelaria pacifica]